MLFRRRRNIIFALLTCSELPKSTALGLGGGCKPATATTNMPPLQGLVGLP
ncbi:hypothetical protein [Desulfonema magnum]|uniref:hypothetical protein n=1 Tax=Desulfonema magnum TaxID=45655 RepID=UPI001A9B0202|nr:hypothetical protein [Desulfonema magnum]